MGGPSSQSQGKIEPLTDPSKGWILRQIDTQPEPLIHLDRDDNGQLLVSAIAERVAQDYLYASGGEYGVRWLEFNRRDERVTKEKFFKTEKQRQVWQEKQEQKDNFSGWESYSDPKTASGGDYGVRWLEFNRRDERVTKEKFFKTEKQREVFLEKKEKEDNYAGLEAFSDPREKQASFTVSKPLKLQREGSGTMVSISNAGEIANAGYSVRSAHMIYDFVKGDYNLLVVFERGDEQEPWNFTGFSFGYGGQGPRGLITFSKIFGLGLDPEKIMSKDWLKEEKGTISISEFK